MNNTTKDKKLKASELIKKECCGIGLLSIEKAELVKMVEKLERDKFILIITCWLLIACFYIVVFA